MTESAVLLQVELVAEDLGRLRRYLPSELAYAAWMVERIGHHVETLDAMLRPTAAERFRANVAFGCEEQAAVDAALADVDADVRRLHRRLGREANA